ncbi:hypothetical protein [Halomicrobium urmianum]|uniref:hypothetical protein n=1 Tax=Halomicrobium urmianum TaxID=1586233 RepID=UPI001CD99F25|nr:hypothetical protein [Halomicrobium urmianum]
MSTDSAWQSLRDRCDGLDPDDVLVTPGDERVFAVERTAPDHVVVRFREGGERRLDRDQFASLAERVGDEPLALDDLPPGVGPYATVLSLAPQYVVDETERLRRVEADAEPTTSPFLRSQWAVRRPPEEVHDDALLVADVLERTDVTDREALSAEELVDLYVLLSDLQWGADDLRRDVGDDLLDHVGPGGDLHGTYGTVARARREYRQLRDEDEVLDALDDAGVPREWVLGVDEEKLDVVIATTDLEEDDVYDVDGRYYVQKTGVEGEAKRSHLQGLRNRLAELDEDEADELRDEIDDLEERIDDVLAAG